MALDDLPESLKAEMARTVADFSVNLIGVDGPSKAPTFGPHASGTLVTIKGKHLLLTAAHVWRALRQVATFGIPQEEMPHAAWLRRDALDAVVMCEGHRNDEWGPDLALIRLEPSIVTTLTARKSFYNMDRDRPWEGQDPTDLSVGVWAIAGAPFEMTVRESHDLKTTLMVVFAQPHLEQVRGGFDYLEFRLDRSARPKIARSQAGVSGGGIWRFRIGLGPEGRPVWDGVPRLHGVAYFQPASGPETAIVRAHGPVSLRHLVTFLAAKG